MNILFITPSYKPAFIYGGPAVSVSELAEALVATGHAVTVYTTTANGKEELPVQAGVPIPVNGVTVYYFNRQTGDHTHVSFPLWKKLWSTAREFDVVNMQSWWSLLILGAGVICQMKKKPYFVSPRGMLSGYSFHQQNSFPKKVLHRLIGGSLLRNSYLHATTELEWRDCQKVVPGWEGFVLPNVVKLPERPPVHLPNNQPNGILTFGFLSRIDHKKGLELLFAALARVPFAFRLKLAGTGAKDYIDSLQRLAQELKIAQHIEWCGWMKGEEKYHFLASIDVFLLTSYNENFANSVIEALAAGVPVMVSEDVGLADYVKKSKTGWVCQTQVSSIYETLCSIHQDREQISHIRKAAPEFINKDFNPIQLAYQYRDAYEQFSERKNSREVASEQPYR